MASSVCIALKASFTSLYRVQLHANFEAVTTPSTEKEAAQLHEVQELLASQKNSTWKSGLDENN